MLNVTATRMEMMRLKKKLLIAKRGHKLLKDKLDELLRISRNLTKKVIPLRIELNQKLTTTLKAIEFSKAPPVEKATTLAIATTSIDLKISKNYKRTLNLITPQYESHIPGKQFIFSQTQISMPFDHYIKIFITQFQQLLCLAQDERYLMMINEEILKTRRRVNALEYILIPNLVLAIREIHMKLEEQERSRLTQLLRIKDILRAETAPPQRLQPSKIKMGVFLL